MAWWIPLIAAAAGAIGGAQKKKDVTNISVGDPTALENQGYDLSRSQLTELENLIKKGPGEADITGANDASKNLTDLLSRLQASGGIASGDELAQSRQQSEALFAPERVAMEQNFEQQRIQNSRLSAQLGRQVNDPILAAKLAQEQTRQGQQLDARHTAYAAQAPQRQLDMAGQLFNVRQGLASQALANRQALFSLGQQAMQNERSWRLGIGQKEHIYGGGSSESIGGGMAGFGQGMGMMGGGGGMGGMGGMMGGGAQQKAGASGGDGWQGWGGQVPSMNVASNGGGMSKQPVQFQSAPQHTTNAGPWATGYRYGGTY